jgi:ankyrin repeat protein
MLFLLDKDVEVNAQDEVGYTALILACQKNHKPR